MKITFKSKDPFNKNHRIVSFYLYSNPLYEHIDNVVCVEAENMSEIGQIFDKVQNIPVLLTGEQNCCWFGDHAKFICYNLNIISKTHNYRY